MPSEMSGGTKVMVKVILIFFLFPVVVDITNLVLGSAVGFLLLLLPKAWRPIDSPLALGFTLTVSVLCGFLAVRQFWPKGTGKRETLASETSATLP